MFVVFKRKTALCKNISRLKIWENPNSSTSVRLTLFKATYCLEPYKRDSTGIWKKVNLLVYLESFTSACMGDLSV